MRPHHGFVRGALLLAGAAVLSKGLGSVYTIVLQNIIGDHGMGLFQMAYPIYATLLAVATAGFPVAISKIVSERVAVGDVYGAKQTFRMALVLLSLGGVLAFVILFGFASTWARVAGDPAAAPAIRAIAPALLIVPVMSVLRGYFQGHQWMEPTAASQVLEQGVRVATILGLAFWLMSRGYGQATAAAGAAFGAVTGACAGLLLLFTYWRNYRPPEHTQPTRTSSVTLAKQLLYYAFPISLGALVVPLMNNIDVITVVNLLKSAGEPQHLATTEFGLLSGRAAKLMMLPTTLAAGIGIAAMPAVTEAFTLGFRELVHERIDMAIRLTVLLSLPAGIGLVLLARPVNIALFQNGAGTGAIEILALATVFASVQATLAAVLQGAGWMYLPVVNLLIASGVKLVLNLWWVPRFGIQGAAAATVASYVTATLLNVGALKRCLNMEVDWLRWLVRPGLAAAIMGSVTFGLSRQLAIWGVLDAGRIAAGLSLLFVISIAIATYIAALLVTNSMDRAELQAVPKVGPQLVSWCDRIGLLK
ncbi:putative polysaccharide biosynthesis protein [Alicyclobacillus sp. ALC3]|uniref:putative polysaccharide biosynthesis protein n=1 Tax=Alicyclobacillus sp. ALC3 TaxID=2796143 RepID=UPI002379589A|nr:polysaccharide biosynthesis protein [Alicyclobacillus sp. ALC3]WDL98989.1 polysaccharide biosynthesis protein [Alicyclobacillus sp. ALC3]